MRVRAGGGWVRLGRRRGFLLIVVLMGLLVMSATVASVVRTAWSGTRQAQWEQAAWQAEWLLEAGWLEAAPLAATPLVPLASSCDEMTTWALRWKPICMTYVTNIE